MRLSIGVLLGASVMFGQTNAALPPNPAADKAAPAATTAASPSAIQGLKEYDSPEVPIFGQKQFFRRFFTQDTPAVQLAAPVRLRDHILNGKLELSLRSYLELVLANNTQIQLQKVLVQPQRNAITRAFSVFDPVATARFQATRQNTPTTDALAGAAILSQLNQPLNLGVTQVLPTGTSYSVGFNGSKVSTNNAFANFNPNINSNLALSFTQPLLRGFGTYQTKVPIYLARTRLKQAEFRLEDTVMRLMVAAENAYWDVIGARENLRVQREALSLAEESLNRAKKELELGAISALEIFQPEATYARAKIFVTQAEFRLQQLEDALRTQISIDLDPDLRSVPLNLTEPVLPPSDQTAFDKEELVREALAFRPDLKANRTQLEADDMSLKQAVNNLRPDLSLIGSYTTQGRGGPFLRRSTIFNPDGSSSPVQTIIPGGVGDALSQMWGFNYPIYGFTLQLRLPLKDRRVSADYADAVVTRRADMLQERLLTQQIRLDVLNAITQVENSRASVELARVAADLAQKRLDAEKKRYDLGTTLFFFVLDAQQALTQAQGELVTNSVQYRRNQLNLLQRTGKLLIDRGVVIQ